MATRRVDTEIDRLYQLPPDEFTPARNVLARTAGTDAADVRRLSKPPIAAWAVNQVYWKRRDIYDALVDASTELRKIHTVILGGRRADLREASKAHEDALDGALKAALAILQDEGHPATDVTRQALLTTLRALPSEDPPGRLTRTLQPGGFEMLAGLSIEGAKGSIRAPTNIRLKAEATTSVSGKAEATKKAEPAQKPESAKSKADVARAEAAKAAAAKVLREAEQAAGRAEFDAVRTTREAEKAAKQVEQAREALDEAKQALDDAKAAAATTAGARDDAQRRSKEAERTLSAARRAVKDAGAS
jgi:hypothetical protein